MARVRQARRCSATAKTTGERCRCYAITGGTVCRKHGGAAPQVKYRALLRRLRDSVDRGLAHDMRRHHEVLVAFHADRVLTAARLLGKPVQEIDRWDIVWCHVEHGVPPLEHEAPPMRRDRRFGPRSWRAAG